MMSGRTGQNYRPTEIYIAPVLGAMSRGAVAQGDPGLASATFTPVWNGAIESEAGRRQRRGPHVAGKPPRLFQRLSRFVRVAADCEYTVRASLRNNPEFPLGPSVYGVAEIIWLDVGGREMARVAGRRFGKELSSARWTGVSIVGARSPSGARNAVVCVSLYDEERDGGSIWVRGLAIGVRPARQEALVAAYGGMGHGR